MFKKWFGGKKEKRSPEEQARELQRLAAAGKKVEAIAIYRELTGVDMAQAKEDIDALIAEAQGAGMTVSITNSPDGMLDELAKGNKIVAIKMFREMSSAGLKEAKEAIDEVEPLLQYGRGEALVRLSEKLAEHPMAAAKSTFSVNMQMVADELQNGNKINAIKIYREMAGVGLKEAKDYVDQLEKQIKQGGGAAMGSASPSGPINAADMPDVIQALRNNRKIEAIKVYREQTGLGLKESKDAVDALQRQLGL